MHYSLLACATDLPSEASGEVARQRRHCHGAFDIAASHYHQVPGLLLKVHKSAYHQVPRLLLKGHNPRCKVGNPSVQLLRTELLKSFQTASNLHLCPVDALDSLVGPGESVASQDADGLLDMHKMSRSSFIALGQMVSLRCSA